MCVIFVYIIDVVFELCLNSERIQQKSKENTKQPKEVTNKTRRQITSKEQNLQASNKPSNHTTKKKQMGSIQSHSTQLQQSATQIHKQKQQIQFKQNDFIRQVEGSIQSEYQIFSPYLKKNEFYELRKAIHLKTKLIRSVYIINKYKVRTVERQALEQQINKLKQIDHPFVNKIYELFKDSHRYFIVMESCFGESLASIIQNQTSISQKRAAYIIQQIFNVLGHCHRKGIIHSDLKLQNIIFNCKKQNIIKIVDFSISRIFRIEDIIEQSKGKAFLSSPQSFTKDITSKSDIWQCGMILYILLCGQAPIMGNKKNALARKIIYFLPTFTQKRMQSVSKQAKDFIRLLLKLNPNDRPTAEMCLQSPWIQKYYNPPMISAINLKRCLLECYHFNPLSKLQEATWSFFVNALVPFLEKQNIVLVFNKLDAEAKGELGFQEIFKGFNQIYQNEQKAQFLTKLLFGRLKRTKITFSQLITIATNRIFLIKESNIKKIFEIFDQDNSGQISVSELKHVLGASKQVSEEIWLQLMKEADANSDGMISFQQFRDMMRSLLNRENEQLFEQRQAQKIQFKELEGNQMAQLQVFE